MTSCSFDALITDDHTLDNYRGVFGCMSVLCSNTCSLPYANQDVFGVGLIISYAIQAGIVLAMAILFIMSISRPVWKSRPFRRTGAFSTIITTMSKGSDKTFNHIAQHSRPLENLLAAQNYFGICATIASFCQKPWSINPLNGYALLSVAVTGFLPTTFTLLLLHSHGIKSRYASVVTMITWTSASVLFWMLFQNLRHLRDDPYASEETLRSIFNLDSCGKSSAMALCKQLSGTQPLEYLSRFYNNEDIPNINTVWLLWLLSLIVLVPLLLLQFLVQVPSPTTTMSIEYHESEEYSAHPLSNKQSKPSVVRRWYTPRSWPWFIILVILSIVFGFALAYQARMVIMYHHADVIDWNGWTFGQIVALMFWFPPLVDFLLSIIRERKTGLGSSHASSVNVGTKGGMAMSMSNFAAGITNGNWTSVGQKSVPNASASLLSPYQIHGQYSHLGSGENLVSDEVRYAGHAKTRDPLTEDVGLAVTAHSPLPSPGFDMGGYYPSQYRPGLGGNGYAAVGTVAYDEEEEYRTGMRRGRMSRDSGVSERTF